MSTQVHKITLSPAQRWVLFNLAHQEKQKVDGSSSARYRRFMAAFGLKTIGSTLRKKEGVRAERAKDEDTTHVFELTAENVEYALQLAAAERNPAAEDIVGDLFDQLQELKAGRSLPPPEETQMFDAETERLEWQPEEKIEDLVKGFAADIVEAGKAFGTEPVKVLEMIRAKIG